MGRIDKLDASVTDKRSFLCVGLDPDLPKLPKGIEKTPSGVVKFCKHIIESTQAYCVGYKLNFAFFEALGAKGWEVLDECKRMIPSTHYTIADAKRGDIGNTARKYASSVFDQMDFDAITISGYMGRDSVEPFLDFEDRTVILLALTSNQGSADFQLKKLASGRCLYEDVIKTSSEWAGPDRLMYVVGATHPYVFERIRQWVPDHYLLVPGVGAQGGTLEDVAEKGRGSSGIKLLVNSSRGIIYASNGEDYAEAAGNAAKALADQMQAYVLKNSQV